MTLPQAAERVGLTPLKMLLLLRLQLGSQMEQVTDAHLRILADKLGVEVIEGDGDQLETLLDPEADPNSRRRVTRQLLARLQRQHRWWPNNCLSDASLRHGVPEHEKGLVRDARDLLVRSGWLRLQTVRYKVTEANVGLNPEYREAIITFISTGETTAELIREWIGGPVDA